HSHLQDSFKLFASQIKEGGTLIRKQGLPLESGITYSIKEDADVTESDIRIGIPGFHNLENATAATEAALMLGVSPEAIKAALGDFRGVKRRFEYIVKTPEHIYIDDYAHPPEELRAAI